MKMKMKMTMNGQKNGWSEGRKDKKLTIFSCVGSIHGSVWSSVSVTILSLLYPN